MFEARAAMLLAPLPSRPKHIHPAPSDGDDDKPLSKRQRCKEAPTRVNEVVTNSNSEGSGQEFAISGKRRGSGNTRGGECMPHELVDTFASKLNSELNSSVSGSESSL